MSWSSAGDVGQLGREFDALEDERIARREHFHAVGRTKRRTLDDDPTIFYDGDSRHLAATSCARP
jgi:hypothetical protein